MLPRILEPYCCEYFDLKTRLTWVSKNSGYLFISKERPGELHHAAARKIRMAQQIKKPLNSLQKAINKEVSVRLKMDLEYRGKMTSVDPYMNVILVDATEYVGGNPSANYGKVVIRGNNVLFVKIASDFPI